MQNDEGVAVDLYIPRKWYVFFATPDALQEGVKGDGTEPLNEGETEMG